MFARDLRDLSGPWTGFWTQNLVRGNMKLRLHFSGNDIDGGGRDPIGEFQVSGIFAEESGRVLFTKSYGSHSVDYSGLWDGTLIYGRWTLNDEEFSDQGEFEIWPDEGSKEMMLELAEFGNAVPAH